MKGIEYTAYLGTIRKRSYDGRLYRVGAYQAQEDAFFIMFEDGKDAGKTRSRSDVAADEEAHVALATTPDATLDAAPESKRHVFAESIGRTCGICGRYRTDPTHSAAPPTPPAVVAEEKVDHPQHYGGVDNLYETIKVLAAWMPDHIVAFCLMNAIKYISRAGKKNPLLEDLRKARWYVDYAIKHLETR